MPGVSVIVPVYQAERTLRRCVDSVREQTFPDWELLLIDDASADASPALCRAYAEKDSRIRFLGLPENAGVSAARNRGIQAARGETLIFLDSDDSYVPHTLETLWNLRLQYRAETAGCALWNIPPHGKAWVETLLPSGLYGKAEVREKILLPLFGERLKAPIFNGYSVRYLFSARLVREAGLSFEGAYLEDDRFVLEYFCNAPDLAVTEMPLYRYYQNPASATRHYMEGLMEVFARHMELKAALGARYGLDRDCPQWRDNSNWANLLIAVANEYAHGNPKTTRQRQREVENLCRRPEFAGAMERLKPEGMGRNKQLVAELLRRRHYGLLTLLYRLKNRI